MLAHRRGHLLSYDNIHPLVSHVNGTVGPVVDYLVGISEIADLLGVSRQRVDAITRTHKDFPEPEAELKSGRIWLRAKVEEWARRDRTTS